VTSFIAEHFEPVRLHVRKHPEAMGRFGANWTPTVLIVDAEGKEHHRIEGFLPVDDFLAQLKLGYAQHAFKTGDFASAEKRFREVLDEFPKSDVAAEALYWAGVSKYKQRNRRRRRAERDSDGISIAVQRERVGEEVVDLGSVTEWHASPDLRPPSRECGATCKRCPSPRAREEGARSADEGAA